jgi:hypothetical protein
MAMGINSMDFASDLHQRQPDASPSVQEIVFGVFFTLAS